MSFLCEQIWDAQHARRAAAQLVTLTREKGGAGVEGHAHLDEGQPTVNRRPSILCVQCSASTTSPPPALQSDPGITTGSIKAHQQYYIIYTHTHADGETEGVTYCVTVCHGLTQKSPQTQI